MAERIAEYELVEEISRGTSGLIWLGQAPASKQLVAIKEMLLEPDSGLSADEQVARFKRESDIHLALAHPNIVRAVGGGTEGDRHYLVMEYQPGATLHAILDGIPGQPTRQRPPIPQVLEWGVQLCSALHYLHEQGVVHRDVKPSNLIVSPAGQLKITDFGMARRTFAPGITQAKMMLGTLNYMSPEQLIDATAVDGRSDVFAAGVILYKALTGELPFFAETATDMAHRLLYADPTDPVELNPHLPRSLADKLLKCLCKDPDFRYLSAESFANDLEDELHRAGVYLAQGRMSMDARDLRDACHYFQQAVAMDNADAQAWFLLGDCLAAIEQHDQANECYLRVIHLDPSHSEAFRRLGESYRQGGNHEAAIKMFQRAWVLDPQDRTISLQLGLSYGAAGRPSEACEHLQILAEQHPDWADAQFELGRALYGKGEMALAREAFQAAYRLAPGRPEVLFNLASLKHELGEMEEARDHYDSLLALQEEHHHARHNLACLLFARGELAEALSQVDEVIAREAAWGPSHVLRAQILEQLGRATEAVGAYRTALELDPADTDTYLRLSALLLAHYQPSGAMEVLVRGLAQDDVRKADLYLQLAVVLRSRGDQAEAAAALHQCLAMAPAGALADQAQALLSQISRKSVR